MSGFQPRGPPSVRYPSSPEKGQGAVESAAARAYGKEVVELEDLPPRIIPCETQPKKREGTLHEAVAEVEKEMIVQTLQELRGNLVRAAAVLGLSRQGLRNKVKKHGLERNLREARRSE